MGDLLVHLEELNTVQLFGSLDCLFMANSTCAQLHSIHQEVRLSEVMKASKRWFALESNVFSKRQTIGLIHRYCRRENVPDEMEIIS